MTEKTVKKVSLPKRHLIDPVMFVIAFVGAPLLITLATFWMLYIPVVALMLGGPVYLIVGVPTLMWWLSHHEPKAGTLALLGFLANLIACGALYIFELSQGGYNVGAMSIIYLIFGSIFAPIWAAMFAVLYAKLRRPFFTQTV